MTKNEALRMAIEIMQRYLKETPLGNQPHMIAHKAEEAIQACIEALAEQPTTEQSSLVQEPVYAIVVDRHILYDTDTGLLEIYNSKEEAEKNTFKGAKIKAIDISINPAPSREWVGLSDAEVDDVFNLGHHTFKEFAHAIEAKLKEKNT